MFLLLWDAKKGLPAPGSPIEPRNVNTGMCYRLEDGKTHIVVYRREEAAKTMAHELLHAYQVGEWCNDDPDVLRGSGRIVRECLFAASGAAASGAAASGAASSGAASSGAASSGAAASGSVPDRRIPGVLKPAEVIVDALAIELCMTVFQGTTRAAVLAKALTGARRLAAHFGTLDPSRPMQTTPAAEYYVLKYHILLCSDELRRAHASGFQRPDKKALRKVFLSAPPVERYMPRSGLPRPVEGASMRMTPKALTVPAGSRRGQHASTFA
jgi:hypothetical protein